MVHAHTMSSMRSGDRKEVGEGACVWAETVTDIAG